MIRSILCLALLSAALGYAALWKGGVWTVDWNISLLLIGVAFAGYWIGLPGREKAPPLRIWIKIPLVLLPCYLAFQLIPLPEGILQLLSPSRLELLLGVQSIDPNLHSAPLAVLPPAATEQLFRYLAYIATFLLLRELCWRFSDHPWVVTSPLIALGALEGGLGMFQLAANWPDGFSRGTLVDRDHYAAMLEMLVPFALMAALAVWRRQDLRYSSPMGPAIVSSVLLALSALMLVGIVFSLSRMGFLVVLSTIFVLGVLSVGPRLPSKRSRAISLGVLGVAVVALFIILPPGKLIERFASISSTEQVSADTRLAYWRESLPLIHDYAAFGAGLGSYDSVFRKYQVTTPTLSVDAAHNDYLQFLAELGIVGFAILVALVGGVIWKLLGALFRGGDVDLNYSYLACFGAILAMLLHSIVDFSVQIPANGMIFAWVCGIAASSSQRRL